MRMNRGTIVLIAALLVVIVAVLVINNNQASAPGVTPTAAVATGPILPGVSANNIVHYEVRDNASGNFTSLTKDSGGAWHIDGTNILPARFPDQSLILSTAGQIVAINYNNTFQDDKLATFGLDKPAYTVLTQTSDGKLYTLYIGSKAPTSSGYYATLVTGTAPLPTAEATTETGAAPQAIATENVTSAQQNGSAVVPATAEATAEATSAVAKKIFETLAQATAEATAQATVDNALSAQQNGSAPVTTAVAASTAEPTAQTSAAATAEATAEATQNVIHNPAVTLSGKLTIYVIPQTVIDTLTKWIATPPYAPLPTPAPTNDTSALATELPTPLLEQGANPNVIPAGTPFGTQQVTPEATAAATAAATAGS